MVKYKSSYQLAASASYPTIKITTRESVVDFVLLGRSASVPSLYSDKDLCDKNAGDLETYW